MTIVASACAYLYALSMHNLGLTKTLAAEPYMENWYILCSDGSVHHVREICSVELIFAYGGVSFTVSQALQSLRNASAQPFA